MRFEIIALGAVLLVGCGKKTDTAAVTKSEVAPKQAVSIDTAPDNAPPPPAPVAVADPAGTAPPPDSPEPPAAVLTPQAAEQQFKNAEKQERAYEERLRRNGKWMQALQKADANEQQRILAEIRAAKLTPAELAELEGIKSYFGVKLSFQ